MDCAAMIPTASPRPAHAVTRLAGERGADQDLVDTRGVDAFGRLLRDHLVALDEEDGLFALPGLDPGVGQRGRR